MATKMVPVAQAFPAESKDWYRSWREPKPCETEWCRHVRMVKVTAHRQHNSSEARLLWESHCAACQALLRALHYEQEAARFRKRYQELKAKQDRKKKE